MRLFTVCSLCVGVSLLATGCRQRESSPDARTTNQAPSNGDQAPDKSTLASRFDAASSMNNVSLKDEALAQLANDASRAGDGEIAKKSIDAIQNIMVHDEAAYNSALSLAKTGKGADAVTVAQSINNLSKRDEALSKVAKGETGN